MDEDEPLTSCHNKAMFLLKFSGLTRVSYDSHRPSSPITSRPSWGQKSSWKLQKSQSVVSTVERIKQQVHNLIMGVVNYYQGQEVGGSDNNASIHFTMVCVFQISRETKPLSPAEKHPSFETVLDFVRNAKITVANVEALLQERANLANKISDGFSFAAEHLRIMSSQSTALEVQQSL